MSAVAFVEGQGFLGNKVIVKVKVAAVAFVEGQDLLERRSRSRWQRPVRS